MEEDVVKISKVNFLSAVNQLVALQRLTKICTWKQSRWHGIKFEKHFLGPLHTSYFFAWIL